MLARGHEMSDCEPHASAFCFIHTSPQGNTRLDCAAELPACLTTHDFLVVNPEVGMAKSDCAERR